MDEFLKPNAQFKRLWEEYHKYGELIIAVDFDSTLYDFHKKGETYKQMIKLVQDLYALNCHIIIWTANKNTEFIKTYLAENNIPYHSINEESPAGLKFLYNSDCSLIPRKLYANAYLDDRGGIIQAYTELELLVYLLAHVKNI